uniref:Factor VIII intron 22 protein n=1 Tax=Magallana gigas TaxID=29159 RepID=K1QXM0_MAGGI
MEKDYDVLGKYRAVSNKLKKRFLKRPNVAEGIEQYSSLSKLLKEQECQQYAAFCALAQARCEHTMVNAAGESQSLTEAARNFLEAEVANQELRCPSFNEHLTAAINCYSHAIRVHIENNSAALAAALCMELGNALKKLNKPGEAMAHYQRAAELQSHSSITGRPVGAYCDFLCLCEISRVLLLMMLQPTPQRIRPEHAQTLEKYTWDFNEDNTTVQYLGEDLFLMLQSIVMACQSSDLISLRLLQTELWPLLSTEQNHLLFLVIQELTHPSGEGV